MPLRSVLSILFGAGFTVATGYAMGRLLLSRLQVQLHRQEQHLFSFAAGMACYSLLIFFLAAAHIAYPAVFLAAGTLLLVSAWRTKLPAAPSLPPLSKLWQWVFVVGLIPFGVLYFVNALAPEWSPDGSQYHLGLVLRYFRAHGFPLITTNMYASLSGGMEMLFLSAFAFGRHSAAALVEFCFLVALPFLVLAWGRRFGFPGAGVFGGLTVFLSPLFGISGTTAYNDVAAVCALFALFFLLQIWAATRQTLLLIPAGLLAGFCFSVKYTLFMAVLYAAGFVAWKCLAPRHRTWAPIAIVAVCSTLIVAPWLAKNWIEVANPFSPFLNRVFPNAYANIDFEQEYTSFMRDTGGLGWKERLVDHIVRGEKFAGFLGPLFLLAPVALLALRDSMGRQMLLAAVLFFLPSLSNTQTRFLMPSALFVALALGLVLQRLPLLIPPLLLAHAWLSWPLMEHSYHPNYVWNLHDFPWREALRIVPEEKALSEHLGGFNASRMVERLVPKTGLVFALSAPPIAYTERNIMVGYESAEGNLIREALYSTTYGAYQANRRLVFRFAPQPIQQLRIVQTASHPSSPWSVSELRFFSGNQELPRASPWRLRAFPAPWDVQLAFDNSPVSRWQTHQPRKGNEWMEVDLGKPELLDTVALECVAEGDIQIHLQRRLPAGQWQSLEQQAEAATNAAYWNYRRAAVLLMRSRGITHLFVNSDDFFAKDIQNNPAAWGVKFLEESVGNKLYQLE